MASRSRSKVPSSEPSIPSFVSTGPTKQPSAAKSRTVKPAASGKNVTSTSAVKTASKVSVTSDAPQAAKRKVVKKAPAVTATNFKSLSSVSSVQEGEKKKKSVQGSNKNVIPGVNERENESRIRSKTWEKQAGRRGEKDESMKNEKMRPVDGIVGEKRDEEGDKKEKMSRHDSPEDEKEESEEQIADATKYSDDFEEYQSDFEQDEESEQQESEEKPIAQFVNANHVSRDLKQGAMREEKEWAEERIAKERIAEYERRAEDEEKERKANEIEDALKIDLKPEWRENDAREEFEDVNVNSGRGSAIHSSQVTDPTPLDSVTYQSETQDELGDLFGVKQARQGESEPIHEPRQMYPSRSSFTGRGQSHFHANYSASPEVQNFGIPSDAVSMARRASLVSPEKRGTSDTRIKSAKRLLKVPKDVQEFCSQFYKLISPLSEPKSGIQILAMDCKYLISVQASCEEFREESLVCLWSLEETQMAEHLLQTRSVVTCIASDDQLTIYAGSSDGSISFWDLREPELPEQRFIRVDGALKTCRSPCFSTSCSSISVTHATPVTGLSLFTKNELRNYYSRLCSVDESGQVILWIRHFDPSDSSRGKLIQETSIKLPEDSLITAMATSASDLFTLFLGSASGHLTRISKFDRPDSSRTNYYELGLQVFSAVTCISFNPIVEDKFLASYMDGTICLFSQNNSQPIYTWDPTELQISHVSSIQWFPKSSISFAALASSSTILIWDLNSNFFNPTHKFQMSRIISFCCLSQPTTQLALGTKEGNIEVVCFKDQEQEVEREIVSKLLNSRKL